MKQTKSHEHKIGWLGWNTGCVICGLMADSTIINPQPKIIVNKWLKTKVTNWRNKI